MSKKRPKRHQWTPDMDALLMELYSEGTSIQMVADTLTQRFKVKRNKSSVQSRLGILRRDGTLEYRGLGKQAKAKAKKMKPEPKAKKLKPEPRVRAKAKANGDQRTLTVDLGSKGSIRVEVKGAIVLYQEAMDDLVLAIGKLMVM